MVLPRDCKCLALGSMNILTVPTAIYCSFSSDKYLLVAFDKSVSQRLLM